MEQETFIHKVLPLRPQLMAYAARMMNSSDDAEDIAQEVLLKLWCMKEELAKYNSIAALSVQITKHLCINALKSKRNMSVNMDVLNGEIATDSPLTQLEEKDEAEHISQIIEKLPGLQQSIMKMKHVEGLEIEEIAALTGSTPEAVRVNLSRARKKVKDLFFKIK